MHIGSWDCDKKHGVGRVFDGTGELKSKDGAERTWDKGKEKRDDINKE